ncbi:MAG: HAD-IA family hydrolase, partial [Luteimonas sp.]|nr:HAD-IA family hydrolase [Luteimonas sp.]
FDSGLEREADLGRLDAQGQVDELARRLGRAISLDDCIAARRAAMRVDLPMLALAERLAAHAGVAILTNNGLMLRDHLATICPALLPLFAGRVACSAQFGLAKPDPAIFRRCLAELGAGAQDTLFIDDKLDNVEGARAAGLHGHHYRNLPTLLAELRQRGLPET